MPEKLTKEMIQEQDKKLRDEIFRCQDVIQKVCGFKPKYFRSPVGLKHPFLSRYLLQADLEYISWQVRSYDSRIQKPEKLLQRIMRNIHDGDIILFHDKPGKATECMLIALPKIIDELKKLGFQFVPINRSFGYEDKTNINFNWREE